MNKQNLLLIMLLFFSSLSLFSERAVLQRGPELTTGARIPWTNSLTGWEAEYSFNAGKFYLFGLATEAEALYYGNFSDCYEGRYETLDADSGFYYIEATNGIQRYYLVTDSIEDKYINGLINALMERLLYFYIQAGNNNFPYPYPAVLEVETS